MHVNLGRAILRFANAYMIRIDGYGTERQPWVATVGFDEQP